MREEFEKALHTRRQPWNNAVWRSMPPSLRGMRPVTKEPWIRDTQIYDVHDPFSVLFDRDPQQARGVDPIGALQPQLEHRLVVRS